MKKTLLLGGMIISVLLVLAGCTATNNQTSTTGEKKEVTTTKTKEISLEDAFRKIGMECKGPDFQATCSWRGVSYTVSKPSDWDKDVQLRNKACDDGYINPEYLLVSNDKSWHISTNQNEDAIELAEELSGVGLGAKTIRYCN